MQRLNELENKDIRVGMGMMYMKMKPDHHWIITDLKYEARYDEYYIYMKNASTGKTYTAAYCTHPKYADRFWYIFDIP